MQEKKGGKKFLETLVKKSVVDIRCFLAAANLGWLAFKGFRVSFFKSFIR